MIPLERGRPYQDSHASYIIGSTGGGAPLWPWALPPYRMVPETIPNRKRPKPFQTKRTKSGETWIRPGASYEIERVVRLGSSSCDKREVTSKKMKRLTKI